jgi:hypothetical protein
MRQYTKVLELSKETGEDSGCTEAYGAIADCYTELGNLELAAKIYASTYRGCSPANREVAPDFLQTRQ